MTTALSAADKVRRVREAWSDQQNQQHPRGRGDQGGQFVAKGTTQTAAKAPPPAMRPASTTPHQETIAEHAQREIWEMRKRNLAKQQRRAKSLSSASSTMRAGSQGLNVTQLQTLLKQLGMNLEVDGKFGRKTEQAIKAIQLKLGEYPTGHASKTLMRRMQDAKALSPCITESVAVQMVRRVRESVFDEALHPRNSRGEFRTVLERINQALTDWSRNGHKGRPISDLQLSRPSLLKVAKKMGVTPRRGASEHEIEDAMLARAKEMDAARGAGKVAGEVASEKPALLTHLETLTDRPSGRRFLTEQRKPELDRIAEHLGIPTQGESKATLTSRILDHTHPGEAPKPAKKAAAKVRAAAPRPVKGRGDAGALSNDELQAIAGLSTKGGANEAGWVRGSELPPATQQHLDSLAAKGWIDKHAGPGEAMYRIKPGQVGAKATPSGALEGDVLPPAPAAATRMSLGHLNRGAIIEGYRDPNNPGKFTNVPETGADPSRIVRVRIQRQEHVNASGDKPDGLIDATHARITGHDTVTGERLDSVPVGRGSYWSWVANPDTQTSADIAGEIVPTRPGIAAPTPKPTAAARVRAVKAPAESVLGGPMDEAETLLHAKSTPDLRRMATAINVQLPATARTKPAVIAAILGQVDDSLRLRDRQPGRQPTRLSVIQDALQATERPTGPGDVAGAVTKLRSVSGGQGAPTEGEVLKILSADPGLTSAKLRQVAAKLGIDLPPDMRAKTSMQMHIAQVMGSGGAGPKGGEASAIRDAMVQDRVKSMRVDAPQPEKLRMAQVAASKDVATAVAELDELVDNGSSAAAIKSRMHSRGLQSNLPPELVDSLSSVTDRASADAVIARLAEQHHLTRYTPPAGGVEPFKRTQHRMIGATQPPEGSLVQVVRPGYEAQIDGKTVRVSDAVVEKLTPAEAGRTQGH